MVGTQYSEAGLVRKLSSGQVVKKELKAGEHIARHNHPGMEIFFTVVKGAFEVLLDGSEQHVVRPGSSLHFHGDSTIEAVALEDSEAFVFLFQV